MKGIDTIMVAILLIIIIVAIITLFYTWTISIFNVLKEAAVISTNKTVITTGTELRLESVTNTSETEIIVYIRNIGIEDIDMNDIEVYLDNNRISTVGY